MNMNIIGRPAVRALAALVLASGAVVGLTACQTGSAPAVPATVEQVKPRPFDATLNERYGGRPVDRIDEEIGRAIQDGQLPSPGCVSHHVVEHPDGGYHLVCVQQGD